MEFHWSFTEAEVGVVTPFEGQRFTQMASGHETLLLEFLFISMKLLLTKSPPFCAPTAYHHRETEKKLLTSAKLHIVPFMALCIKV